MTDIIVGSHILFANGSKGVVVAYNDNEMTYLPTAQSVTIDLNTGVIFTLDPDFLPSAVDAVAANTTDTVTTTDSGTGAASSVESTISGGSDFLAAGGEESVDAEDSASTAVS